MVPGTNTSYPTASRATDIPSHSMLARMKIERMMRDVVVVNIVLE